MVLLSLFELAVDKVLQQYHLDDLDDLNDILPSVILSYVKEKIYTRELCMLAVRAHMHNLRFL